MINSRPVALTLALILWPFHLSDDSDPVYDSMQTDVLESYFAEWPDDRKADFYALLTEEITPLTGGNLPGNRAITREFIAAINRAITRHEAKYVH